MSIRFREEGFHLDAAPGSPPRVESRRGNSWPPFRTLAFYLGRIRAPPSPPTHPTSRSRPQWSVPAALFSLNLYQNPLANTLLGKRGGPRSSLVYCMGVPDTARSFPGWRRSGCGWVGWWGSGWVDGQPCSPSANADGKNVDGDKPRQPKNDQASKREASRLTALARRAVAKPKPSAKAKAKQPCRC